MIGLKMELIACADLVGGTMEQSCLFPDTTIFVVDCCQFGHSWIVELNMEFMACAGLVGGTTEQSCLFPDIL